MQDVEQNCLVAASMGRRLIDGDTAIEAEPEDLPLLDIATSGIPGADASHATSTVWYLEECIPGAQYWGAAAVGSNRSGDGGASIEFLNNVRR
jgi:hypothetical protein